MLLDVPLTLQSKKSKDCGPACVHMLLKFYKKDVSFDNILNNIIRTKDGGTTILQKARFIESTGLVPEIILSHYNFFEGESNTNEMQLALKEHLSKNISKKHTDFLLDLQNYLESHQDIHTYFINSKLIESSIMHNQPIIVSVNVAFFKKKLFPRKRHNILITGFDDNYFYYNDPHSLNGGKNKKINKEHLLIAMYHTPFPSILVIKNDS